MKRFSHQPLAIILTGKAEERIHTIARYLEKGLFDEGHNSYFLGVSERFADAAEGFTDKTVGRMHQIEQVGEIAHFFLDSGHIFITAIANLDEYELCLLKKII